MSKFVNYQELEKIVQESKVGVRAKVQSNPYGEGGEQELTFATDEFGNLTTKCFNQYSEPSILTQKNMMITYAYNGVDWINKYKSTFELVEPAYIKPEVYAVGDWVVVTKEIKKCGDYKERHCYIRNVTNQIIGKPLQIKDVFDDFCGISYCLGEINYPNDNSTYSFPHYAVQRVSPPESETIEVNGKIYLKSEYDLAIVGLEEIKK